MWFIKFYNLPGEHPCQTYSIEHREATLCQYIGDALMALTGRSPELPEPGNGAVYVVNPPERTITARLAHQVIADLVNMD